MSVELNYENGTITSVKRLSDGEIFKIGDRVDLLYNVESAGLENYQIISFQEKRGGNHHFPHVTEDSEWAWDAGTILTKEGVIAIKNVYKVSQEEIEFWDQSKTFTPREMIEFFPKTKPKKIKKIFRK